MQYNALPGPQALSRLGRGSTLRLYLAFIRGSWPLLAFGFASIFWGNFGQSFFISWYGLAIQQSLGLSAGQYGSLYSGATLCSGVLIMAFGGMIDRWPLQRFVLLPALGLIAACLTMAAAVHPAILLPGLFLLRLCGQGLLPHTAQTTMARYFEHHRGKALSIAASGIPAGEVILPLGVVTLIALVGWRSSWLVLALSVVVIYLPLSAWLLRTAPEDTRTSPVASASHRAAGSAGRREMLADPRFWLALPTMLAGPFIVTGIFIHQGFIIDSKDWTPAWLATCFVVYGIVHWLSAMTTGVLIDRFSARFLLRIMPLPLAGALLTLVLLDGRWVAPLFMLLLGMSIGMQSPVGGALWAEVYGTARLGAIRSLVTSLMILSTAVSPLMFGLLIDRQLSLQAIFGGSCWGILAAAVLVQFSYPPGTRASTGTYRQ